MKNSQSIELTNMQNHFISQAKELGKLIFYNLDSEARGRKVCKSLVRKNLFQEHEQEGDVIYYLTTTGVNYVNSLNPTTPSITSPIPLELSIEEEIDPYKDPREFSKEDTWGEESEAEDDEEDEEWVEGEEEFSAYIKKQEQEEEEEERIEREEKIERIEIRQEREAKTLSPIGSIRKGDTIKTSSCTGTIVKYCSNKEIHLDCKGIISIISKVDILEILKN